MEDTHTESGLTLLLYEASQKTGKKRVQYWDEIMHWVAQQHNEATEDLEQQNRLIKMVHGASIKKNES